MIRPLLLALALAAFGGDAFAQSFPRAVLASADHYVIKVHYREAPPSASRDLHEAYVTVTPVGRRPRALWDGSLRAVQLHPTRATARVDGAVMLTEVDGGRYFGYGMVPAPGSLKAATFIDYRDASAAYDLNPNEAYDDPDEGGGDGDPKEPTPTPPTDDSPGDKDPDPGEDDWPLIDPWEDDPKPTPAPAPPDWEVDPDDLVNPWPGRKFAGGGSVYLAY